MRRLLPAVSSTGVAGGSGRRPARRPERTRRRPGCPARSAPRQRIVVGAPAGRWRRCPRTPGRRPGRLRRPWTSRGMASNNPVLRDLARAGIGVGALLHERPTPGGRTGGNSLPPNLGDRRPRSQPECGGSGDRYRVVACRCLVLAGDVAAGAAVPAVRRRTAAVGTDRAPGPEHAGRPAGTTEKRGSTCHDGRMEISTERLVLREYAAGDHDAVHAFASDPRVCGFVEWGPNTPEDTRAFLRACLDEQNAEPRQTYTLAITVDGRVIGFDRADARRLRRRHRRNRRAEIGYVLAADAWGNGYATEAAAAMLDFARESLGMRAGRRDLPAGKHRLHPRAGKGRPAPDRLPARAQDHRRRRTGFAALRDRPLPTSGLATGGGLPLRTGPEAPR